MIRLICLKCGSKRVDNGSSLLFSILGIALLMASSYLLLSCSSFPFSSNWDYFIPLEHQDCLPGLLTFCLGMSILWHGQYHSEQVRCLNCGAI
jgi:hypothetical protein